MAFSFPILTFYTHQSSPKILASFLLLFSSFFFFSDNIAQEKGKSIFFRLFLALVSSVTCTFKKKNCNYMLPKFHLFPFLPFIHTNSWVRLY